MRWALAALAFGLLVSLAIATVAIRAGNLKKRLWLKQIDERVVSYSIETSRRQMWARDEVTAEGLARELQYWIERTAPQQ